MADTSVLANGIKSIVPGGSIQVLLWFFAAVLFLGLIAGFFFYYRMYKHRLNVLAEYGTGLEWQEFRARVIYTKTGDPKEIAILFKKKRIPYPTEGMSAIPQGNVLHFHYYKDGNGNYKPLAFDAASLTYVVQDVDDKAWFEHKVLENHRKYQTNPYLMFVVSIAIIGIVAIGSGIMLYYYADRLVTMSQAHESAELGRAEAIARATDSMVNLTIQLDNLAMHLGVRVNLNLSTLNGSQLPNNNNNNNGVIITKVTP